jgi:hypothetical protein
MQQQGFLCEQGAAHQRLPDGAVVATGGRDAKYLEHNSFGTVGKQHMSPIEYSSRLFGTVLSVV